MKPKLPPGLSFILLSWKVFCAFVALFFLAQNTLPAQGIPGTPAGFEIDGNYQAAGDDDWNTVFGVDNNFCPYGLMVLQATWVVDDLWNGSNQDGTAFDANAKNPDNIGTGQMPWQTAPGSGPQKNDLTNTMMHTRLDDLGNLWVIFAAETRAANGDSHVDWEFNQAGVSYDPIAGEIVGNGPVGGRTIGDILLVANYVNGGGQEQLEFFIWEEDAPGSTTGHWNQIPLPLDGTSFLVVNEEEIPALCGNSSFEPDGDPSPVSIALQFAEGAINLTAFGHDPSDPCLNSATITVKTRTSASFTSVLKDFTLFGYPGLPGAVADAGEDQALCQASGGTTVFELNGTAENGTPSWDVIETTGSASATIDDPSSLTSLVEVSGTGTVSIELSVESTYGCPEALDTIVLTVYSNPGASFTADNECDGDAVQFSNGSTAGSNPGALAYAWDFGDGNSSTDENPSHTYAAAGDYVVTLTVSQDDENGAICTDSYELTVTVYSNPEASFTADNECDGDAVQFSNGSTAGSNPGALAYAWDFGDGNSSTDENPSHTYAAAGDYLVTLTVSQDDGDGAICTDSYELTVTVYSNPEASFTADNECDGDAVQFSNGSTAGSNPGALTYAWDFGDTNTSTEESPSHTYAAAGDYVVTLTVSQDDENGAICTDSYELTVTVYSNPEASFTADNECDGDAVQFSNGSTAGSNPGALAYAWDFGDGNSSTDENPSHTYAAAGDYVVTLTVSQDDENGAICTDSYELTVTVYSNPEASFTADNECDGDAVQFSNGSTAGSNPGALTYAWDFGDGNSSTDENPSHTYAAAGDYVVTLTVSQDDENGAICTDSYELTVTVFESPTCAITADPETPICGSTGNTLSVVDAYFGYSWTLLTADPTWEITGGQGTSSITYTAGTSGTSATFGLEVKDANGCTGYCEITLTCTGVPLCFYTPGFWSNQGVRTGLMQQLLNTNGGITIGDATAPCANPFEFTTSSASCLDVLLPGPPLPTVPNIMNQCGPAANGIVVNSYLWHLIALTMNVYNTPGSANYLLGEVSCPVNLNGTGLGPNNTIQDLLDAANASYACGNFNSAFINAMTALDECKTGCEESSFGPLEFGNAQTAPGLAVFPNPAYTTIGIKVGLEQEQAVLITLFDHLGNAVLQERVNAGGDLTVTIDLGKHRLPSGFYFVNVKAEEFNVSEKLLIGN